MNQIANKFLLAGDKFMPKMNLKQPGFTYSACRPKKEFKNLEKQEIQTTVTKMNLRRPVFNNQQSLKSPYGMAYGDFKDLKRRIASDKILTDKAFNIAKILNMMVIKELLWFTNFLIKSQKIVVLLIMRLNKIYN